MSLDAQASKTKYDLRCSEEIITSPQTASCPDVKYFRVLLDQFLTNDIIGSCALAKILDVMIDREMSFPEGEIRRRQSLVTRTYKRKVLTVDSQYVRKNLDLLEQGPHYGVPFPPKFDVPFYIVLCTIYRTFCVCHLNLHTRFNAFAFNIQL